MLDERIERAVGSAPVAYTPRPGGYSVADRFSVKLADGRSVFVKSTEEEHLARWLRREHEVYTSVTGDFIPRLEGWDDHGVRPVLALEDLAAFVAGVWAAVVGLPPPQTAPEVRAMQRAQLAVALDWLKRDLL